MTITYTLEKDGSLTIVDDADGRTDEENRPMGSHRSIDARQIPAHRRDPDFEASLPDDIRRKLGPNKA